MAQRAEVARRRVEAREGFLAGTNSFVDAFPDLVGAELDDRVLVRGRLAALQPAESGREVERQDPIPELGDPERHEEARAAKAETLDVEERADALLRRFLTGVDAFLVRHPELSDAGLKPRRDRLQAVVEAAGVPLADPEVQAEAEARATRADQDLAALDRLQTALRLHVVVGAPLPEIGDDLAALDDPHKMNGAEARLRLVLPFLAAADQTPVRDQLDAFYSGAALERAKEELAQAVAVLEAPLEEPTEELQVLEVRSETRSALVAELEGQVAALPTSPARALAEVQLETANRRLQLTLRRIEIKKGGSAADVGAVIADAERARKEAQSAAASAKDDQQRKSAAFLARAADASERLQQLAETLESRKAAKGQAENELKTAIGELSTTLEEIATASPLPGTGPDADDAYSTLRTLRTGLMDGEVARGEAVRTASERVAEVRARGVEDRAHLAVGSELKGDQVVAAAGIWRSSLEKEALVAEELLAEAHAEREVVLTSLQRINEIRRAMRRYVSWGQRDLDASALVPDIIRELRLLGPTVSSRVSQRAGEILSFPGRLIRDPTLFGGVISGLFWSILLLGGWSWGRGKSAEFAGRLAIQLRRVRPSLRPMDLHRLKPPTTDAVRAIIDLTLGQLMVWLISPLSPEIAFLVQAWLLMALYRALLAIFDLAVVRAPDFRPSFLALAASSYDLVRFSARVFIIWMIARGFTNYVLWGMLQLDSVTGLVMSLFSYVGLGLAIWLLYQWDPMLRERIRARNQDSTLVAFLSRDVPRPLRPLSALAMLIFFAVSIVVDFGYFLIARDRTGLARLFNVISRFQMSAEETQAEVRLAPELLDDLCRSESSHAVYVPRPEFDAGVDAALKSWLESGRRGMIALVGDRGEGKRTEFSRIATKVEALDLVVVRARMQAVQTDERMLLDWIGELAGLPPGLAADDLIERLREMDKRVFLLGQMHRTFSRAVGGFHGISTLLYVLNGSSDRHMWVLGMHRPAWQYLASIPSLVDVGVFGSVLSLEPFDGAMLRELTLNRCRAADLKVDFRHLMRANLLGADLEVEQERAINSFYRLLAEASDGNPRVAMRLFTSCIEAGTEPNSAHVHARRALGTEVASEVGIDALFTLVALRQQDAMKLNEIVEVTNLPEHRVRNTVRDLQSRGLVAAEGGQLYIPIQRLPIVSRTLRRRHLLYLGN